MSSAPSPLVADEGVLLWVRLRPGMLNHKNSVNTLDGNPARPQAEDPGRLIMRLTAFPQAKRCDRLIQKGESARQSCFLPKVYLHKVPQRLILCLSALLHLPRRLRASLPASQAKQAQLNEKHYKHGINQLNARDKRKRINQAKGWLN